MELAHFEEAAVQQGNQYLVGEEYILAHHGMMGVGGIGMGGVFSLTAWIFWLLVVALFVALIRWIWKQGDKK